MSSGERHRYWYLDTRPGLSLLRDPKGDDLMRRRDRKAQWPVNVSFEDSSDGASARSLGPFSMGVVVQSTRIGGLNYFDLIDVATMRQIARIDTTGEWVCDESPYESYHKMFVTAA